MAERLYSDLIEQAYKIKHLRKNAEELVSMGFIRSEGMEMPTVQEEARKILETYDPEGNNSLIQRLKEGEKLEKIVDEIIIKKERSDEGFLKRAVGYVFNKKGRKEYNRQVEQLEEILPGATNLRIKHPLNGNAVIGRFLSWGVATAATMGFIFPNLISFTNPSITPASFGPEYYNLLVPTLSVLGGLSGEYMLANPEIYLGREESLRSLAREMDEILIGEQGE